MSSPGFPGPARAGLWQEHPWLAAISLAAVIAGILFRLKGLGTWPLAVDEYYLARSVENVLRAGVPAYECGGYYPRGLLLQYLIALLQLAGLTPELAPRLVAVLSSLIALPAVYLLGQRVHGRAVGLLAVIILSLSVWEVEMARFGRMYAPFQAVFVWYMVFFLRYTVDRDTRALWAMALLTIIGALVWEGAALLALANFLPPFLQHDAGRLSGRAWGYLAGALLLFVPILWLATNDLRFASAEPPFPADYDLGAIGRALAERQATVPPWTTLAGGMPWAALFLVPLAAAAFALRWMWSLRGRWLTALGLTLALAAALLHQFLACALILLLLLLVRLLDWRELFTRAALPFHAALVACAVFWVAFGLLTEGWRNPEVPTWMGRSKALALAFEFVRFPDFITEIARPWGGAVPLLSLGLFLLIGAAVILTIIRDREPLSAARAALVVLVCMLIAASAADPPRHETRYVFFVYPLAVIVALYGIARLVSLSADRRAIAVPLTAAIALAGFALTEDFDTRHLFNIDTAAVNFRVDATGREESHFHPRSDVRGAAEWLSRNAANPGDLVINGVPSVDFYFDGFDFTYIDRHHQRFGAYACRRGTVERWGNRPLLSSVDALASHISTNGRAFLVIDLLQWPKMQPQLAPLQPRVVWKSVDDQISIVTFGNDAAPSSRTGTGPRPDRHAHVLRDFHRR